MARYGETRIRNTKKESLYFLREFYCCGTAVSVLLNLERTDGRNDSGVVLPKRPLLFSFSFFFFSQDGIENQKHVQVSL